MTMQFFHDPVLLEESLHYLITEAGQTYVDGTVGGGGHAVELCERLRGRATVVCFDADADALAFARTRLDRFAEHVRFIHDNFRNLKRSLATIDIRTIDGLILDLGVSSFQLDEHAKGFSYRTEAPIDMRMDRRQLRTGLEVVNSYDEVRLADVLWNYGEERYARRIARAIVYARPLNNTTALADVVRSACDPRHSTSALSRVFQAIRIEVNDELQSLARVLPDALDILREHGRLVVISYHSLEDRMVKGFFGMQSATSIPSGSKLAPDKPVTPKLRVLTKKPVVPSHEEFGRNPRARSAKMRAAERISG